MIFLLCLPGMAILASTQNEIPKLRVILIVSKSYSLTKKQNECLWQEAPTTESKDLWIETNLPIVKSDDLFGKRLQSLRV